MCALADEGIWLPNGLPVKRIQEKYGVEVTDAFLTRLRTASIRMNNGGSASFVSPRGLIFTNHHVAADCIQKISSPGHDFMKDGFWAPAGNDEKACPDLEVNQLSGISDVTAPVKEGLDALAPADANRRRQARIGEIEKECNARTGDRCDVVTLYSGGLYHLYRYKKYTDIRLVFAPEHDVAAFGGDPDNFTYPRYCLDFAFFRAYENGQPALTPVYLAWSKTGARDGELTFLAGHPGNTGRLATTGELDFLRDTAYPFVLSYLQATIDSLLGFAGGSAENKRAALDQIDSQRNSFKAVTGFLRGLRDPQLMARKRDEEKTLRASVERDPQRRERLGKTWDEVRAAYAEYARYYKEMALFERQPVRGSDLFELVLQTLRYPVEKAKPSPERLREYADARLPVIEQAIFADVPLSETLETAVLASYFRVLVKEFGAGHEVVKKLLDGKSPEEAASGYVTGTRLKDTAERKRLAGNAAEAAASQDPMMRLARILDAEGRKVRKMYEDRVEAVATSASSKIAEARFALSGAGDYPDATFTLRFSYGPVKGYTNAKGEKVQWATGFAGLYRRATGKEPFALPSRWQKAKNSLRLKTGFNFVTTCDTHGGNSGSPTVNTNGEVIGILFDGNIEGLPNRFVYREERERSVHVASQGIVEALRKVYRADRILAELAVR